VETGKVLHVVHSKTSAKNIKYSTSPPTPGTKAPSDQGLLIIEAWRSHSKPLHSVGFLWTRDRQITRTHTWQNTTVTRDRHSCSQRNSNPQSQQKSCRSRNSWTARYYRDEYIYFCKSRVSFHPKFVLHL